MGTWSRGKDVWLDQPETAVKDWEPFYLRGERLLRTWIRLALSEKSELKLRMGCGFQMDAETNEFMGAVIKIEMNDKEIAVFKPAELQQMADFMRRLYAEDAKMAEFGENHRQDALGFIDALEHGISEAKKFEQHHGRPN